jgi:hypothetical protein
VAHVLVARLCTFVADFVQGVMHLNHLMTVALRDMHVHCHMFREATHQVGCHKHINILLHVRRQLIVLAATPNQMIPIGEGTPRVLRPLAQRAALILEHLVHELLVKVHPGRAHLPWP